MILVTGGAGFIGANFVLDWLAQSGEPVVNLDALTYAGNLENLASLHGDARHVFVQRRHRRPRAASTALLAEHRPRAIVHFAAESHVDRSIHGPGGVHPDQRRRHVHAARGGARATGRRCRAPSRRPSASSTSRPTRSTARSRRTTRRSPRPTRYEPNSPYSASKAASDHLVRAWHHTYGLPVLTTNCSNNYGPYHFPEKLIPLMIVNALAGKPLPVYGDGQQVRDWLYVKDHCSAIREVLGARPRRRDLQHRRLEREAQPRDRARRLRAARRAAARAPTAQLRAADHARHRPPRPRPPLRDRRAQDRARARLEAGRDLRDRHPQDRALVPRQRRLGRATCRAAPTATGSRRNYERRGGR